MAGLTEFLIELYAPKADCSAVTTATARLSRHLRVIRSIFVAEDETCFVLVKAASAEEVRAAATRAALPFERIVETTFDIDEQPTPAREVKR
jgi:hypothetical protein